MPYLGNLLARNTRLYWGFCPLQTPGGEIWCVSHTLFQNLCFNLESKNLSWSILELFWRCLV